MQALLMQKSNTTQIKKIIFAQFVVSLLAGVVSWLINQSIVLSVFAGGLIASLPNSYFAWKVFARQREVGSAEILSACYRAEVGKAVLTIMLFVAAIIAIKPLNIIALMSVYLFITMIPWLASFYINDDESRRQH